MFGSLGCAFGVDGFIRGSCVHPHSHGGSLGSSGMVRFTSACPRSSWVHSARLGSQARTLGYDWFIWGRWVHLRTPCLSFCSSAVNRARARSGWVHPGWFGLLARTLADDWFKTGSLGALAYALFCRFVYPLSLGSLARLACRCVQPGSLGSLARALWVVVFTWGCWVHLRASWMSMCSPGIVGYFARLPGLSVHLRSLGSIVRPGGLFVHPVSSGQLTLALRVDNFFSLLVCALGVAGFTGVRPGVVAFISGSWVHSCVL